MKKRILFLSDIDSSHTRKWAISLVERGNKIGVFSLKKSDTNWFEKYPNIEVFDAKGFGQDKFHKSGSSKLSYLSVIPFLKKTILSFQPNIVHAHYATSYGLLGVCSKFHPLVISVWGSDIFEFPKKSILHRLLIFNNLKNADAIFSTSEIMKMETQQYTNKKIEVTPFGVDVNYFCKKSVMPLFNPGTKVVGTIKSLETVYGIDVLIRSFSLVKKQYQGELKLLVCGSGTKEKELKNFADESGYSSDIIFTGKIAQENVAEYHNQIDIFANLSHQESFGVAVIEAMACENPVVITAIGGLKEVVEKDVSGIFVEPGNAEQTSIAILKLLNDPAKSNEIGIAGRKRVMKYYNWEKNLDHIEKLYSDILKKKQ